MSSFWTEYAQRQGVKLSHTKTGQVVATSVKNGKLLASGASEAIAMGAAAKKLALGQAASRIARSQMASRK